MRNKVGAVTTMLIEGWWTVVVEMGFELKAYPVFCLDGRSCLLSSRKHWKFHCFHVSSLVKAEQ